jgi:hypothetical protein
MNFESIGVNVSKSSLMNIKVINSLKEEINKKYTINLEMKAELIKEEDTNGKFKEYREKIEDSILKCNKDIKLLDKLERKINGYKTIKIENDGDYDSNIVRIIFPKGTKKKFIEKWLINNDYPIRTQHFHINSDYDCTGKVHTIWVSKKANVVEVEYCYDV